ncbi:MAG: ABC transporter permease subunit [Marinifilaceae bacterium]|jgi:ABC-2 type transport system permease protein|nr:ABC transporter permease subunit [Marinifilaceae bacterium]
MNKIYLIAKRELQTFFDSLSAYIILILFLGFSGFFTWMYGANIFFIGQASLSAFFSIAYWSLFFFIPAITMKMIAEERRMGTIELTLTKSITDREFVLGKAAASLSLIIIALLFTIPYVITLANIGNIDFGGIMCGYVALVLMSASYVSIGIFASSISKNQIVAFLISLSIGIFFHIIFGMLASGSIGFTGELFNYLSMSSHFESMSRGVVDSKDLIYFFSLMVLSLYFAELNLSRRLLPNN